MSNDGDAFRDVPSTNMAGAELQGSGISVVDLLVRSGLAASKRDARRLIEGGGVYLNNNRVTETGARVGMTQVIQGEFFLLRRGSKKYHVFRLKEGDENDKD